MENGDIPDENIQASSTYSAAFAAWKGRLNWPTSWYDVSSDIFSWIQADIGYQTSVSGVVTQGSGGHDGDYWVTAIKVSTFQLSLDDEEVFIADDNGNDMVISPPLNRTLLHRIKMQWVTVKISPWVTDFLNFLRSF